MIRGWPTPGTKRKEKKQVIKEKIKNSYVVMLSLPTFDTRLAESLERIHQYSLSYGSGGSRGGCGGRAPSPQTVRFFLVHAHGQLRKCLHML